MTIIELALIVGIVWFGLCLFVADAIATRRWRNKEMNRNVAELTAWLQRTHRIGN